MVNEEKYCAKCNKPYVCERHHILPKSIFGEGETDFLCPNCHAEYHRYLGHRYLRKENAQPMEFYLGKYYNWLYGLGIIALIFWLLG